MGSNPTYCALNQQVHRFWLEMQGFFCANGDKKRIEQVGHIVDRSAHFCQELFAVCLTYIRIAHKFDIAVDAG
jgi:hypothetical protein